MERDTHLIPASEAAGYPEPESVRGTLLPYEQVRQPHDCTDRCSPDDATGITHPDRPDSRLLDVIADNRRLLAGLRVGSGPAVITLATLRRPIGAILLTCHVVASAADSDLLRELLDLPSAALEAIDDGVGDRLAAKHGGPDGLDGLLLDPGFVEQQVAEYPSLDPDLTFGLLVQLITGTERLLAEIVDLGSAPSMIADAAFDAENPLATLLHLLLGHEDPD
ncbi:hypothetical protein [Microlunatus speluncae]|uniref:hypothetical protein n=1 Tax=Microlunatus speluncae TaxID=2594267 RepID=UPI001266525E|nr:hypothetical protein [Microlunatus speluncae]